SHTDRIDDCWEWGLARSPSGYGKIKHAGRHYRVHRLVWTLLRGPIPRGLFVCHHCDNPPCVKIDHLFLGTPADNSADMVRKGRAAKGCHVPPERRLRGTRNPVSKLTEAKVRQIRKQYVSGISQSSIARHFGVKQPCISAIVLGQNWKDAGG